MKRTVGSGSRPRVISDTSPLHYLILIDQAELLHQIYRHVAIPQAVFEELQRTQTPESVRAWLSRRPDWLEVARHTGVPVTDAPLARLGHGEREVIALARARQADLVIMDDREGVDEALRAGLTVTGTLGVLDRAAEHGLVDLPGVLTRLQTTNFRAAPKLIRALLDQDQERKRPLRE